MKKVIYIFSLFLIILIMNTGLVNASNDNFTVYTNNCPGGEDWKHEFHKKDLSSGKMARQVTGWVKKDVNEITISFVESVSGSVSYSASFSNSVDWVLLPSKNIVIEDINVYDSLKCVKNVLINSIEFKRKSYDKLDKIYINVEFDYTNYDKVNFVYIQIKYIDEDGNSFVYNSDVAKFGNETTILINM